MGLGLPIAGAGYCEVQEGIPKIELKSPCCDTAVSLYEQIQNNSKEVQFSPRSHKGELLAPSYSTIYGPQHRPHLAFEKVTCSTMVGLKLVSYNLHF